MALLIPYIHTIYYFKADFMAYLRIDTSGGGVNFGALFH